MRKALPLLIAIALSVVPAAFATQADDNSVAIIGADAGASPFIQKLRLRVTDPTAIRSIQFTIAPKDGSVTRPVSATYLPSYLQQRGFFDGTNVYTLPVWGLYAGRGNTVTLHYLYNDLSYDEETVVLITPTFSDSCDFENPTVTQARSDTKDLSFDFIMVASSCSTNSPHILDTDGEIRWVGTAGVQTLLTAVFYDNALYIGDGPRLLRMELDGAVTVINDYTSDGAVGFHHNIEIGRDGLLLEVDTTGQVEAVIWEVNPITGVIQKRFNFAQILDAVIRGAGEDPGDPNTPGSFIRNANGNYGFNAPEDWFHNNAGTYRSADNTLVVSSRENFVIAVDYDTKEVKWIFGDHTKRWYVDFASLRALAINTTAGTVPPIGEHAVSITADNNLLLFDNGQQSANQNPKGLQRGFANARKYSLDLNADIATQLWSYPGDNSVFSPFCSSVYEDAPLNYMLDYAVQGGIPGGTARISALTSTGEKVFDYAYPTGACDDAYRSLPIHLEETAFPISNVHLAEISSRGLVGSGNDVMIAGFIITGPAAKPLVIRGLGPSVPVEGHLADPTLELYDSSGNLIASNDNYADSAGLPIVMREGLTPTDSREAVLAPVLAPGSYTAVLRGAPSNRDGGPVIGSGSDTTGLGLIEVYDVDLRNSSKLGNLSTRALVGTGNNVLIGGLLVRGNAKHQIVFRAMGPSLQEFGVTNPLADPTLEIVNAQGVSVATNDDWANGPNVADLQEAGLAPTMPKESAILLNLVTGDYTAVVRGKDGTTGTALVEVYQLGQ